MQIENYETLSLEAQQEVAQYVVERRAYRQAPGPSIGADRIKSHFGGMSLADNKHVWACFHEEKLVGVADVTFDPSVYSKYGYTFIENSLPIGDDRAITTLIDASLAVMPESMVGVLVIDQVTGEPTLPTRMMSVCHEMGSDKYSVDYMSETALAAMSLNEPQPPVGYTIVEDEEHLSEAQLSEYYELLAVMSGDAPTGTLDIEAEVQTEADRASFKESLFSDGRSEVATFLLEESGSVVGFSRAASDSASLDSWQQLGTMVAVEHRGKGLGRVVKEVNLSRIKNCSPAEACVRTTVDKDNHGMLALNAKFGFRTVGAEILSLAARP